MYIKKGIKQIIDKFKLADKFIIRVTGKFTSNFTDKFKIGVASKFKIEVIDELVRFSCYRDCNEMIFTNQFMICSKYY